MITTRVRRVAVAMSACLLSAPLAAAGGGECEPEWSALGSEVNFTVRALAVFDDGSGPALYAGGAFNEAGGNPANRIARWDGSSWSPLGTGLEGFFSSVLTLAVFDDGTGPALYAGGRFTQAGGSPANNIARWDGAAWSPLGTGVNDPSGSFVYSLIVFDDGSGPALYAGGLFSTAGGNPANGIARWDGAAWSPLDAGVGSAVYALAAFDDGNGPALYAGGDFILASGSEVNGIARWDGTAWSALNSGVDNAVYSLTVFDHGSGPALYAGGQFFQASGSPANNIARWDGTAWSALGSGVTDNTENVYALRVFDDGSGPALYVGGDFALAGGSPASRIARWDGAAWSALDLGVNSDVFALTLFDDGSGSTLYAGGAFTQAGGSPAGRIARWGSPCVSPPCPADVDESGAIDLDDLNLVLTNFGQTTSAGDTNGDGVVNLDDLNAVLTAFGTECP